MFLLFPERAKKIKFTHIWRSRLIPFVISLCAGLNFCSAGDNLLSRTVSTTSESTTHSNTNVPATLSSNSMQWSVSLRWENDTFSGTDRFYTDGVSLSIAHTGPSWIDFIADRIPCAKGRRTVAYEIGQIMVTPSDTKLAVPDPNDRPYAGILYVAVSIHIDHTNYYNGFKFITGVVGPWSLAEETQKQVHRWIHASLPQGWDYQLHTEPVLNLVYEHRRKYQIIGKSNGFGVEILPAGNIMLGNVLCQAQAGTQLRIGYNIPHDFGTTLMRGMVHMPPPRETSPKFGVYFYGGVHGNFVARDITLDGNTWKNSPSVDKEWFVPAAEVGMSVKCSRLIAAFSYVFWGQEFKNQPEHSEFGAFTVSYLF